MDHSAGTMSDRVVVSRARNRTALLVAAAYAVLGTILLLTRFVGLGHSFWFDELFFVAHFVREGPGEILAGPDLSHELMAIAAWATRSIVGESETAFRLWSVVPFVAGVTVVTAWLHSRVDALSGVLFLFLATVSPLLLDITRQARGYGLAFLAMSILVVAALEAVRDGRTARGRSHVRCGRDRNLDAASARHRLRRDRSSRCERHASAALDGDRSGRLRCCDRRVVCAAPRAGPLSLADP